MDDAAADSEASAGEEIDLEAEIERLAGADSLSAGERVRLAELLVRAADEAGRNCDVVAEDEYLDRLEGLAAAADDGRVRAEYARALANGTDVASRGERFLAAATTDRLNGRVHTLAELAWDHESLLPAYARTLANMVTVAGKDGSILAIEGRIEEIEKLRSHHGDEHEPELARQLARALVAKARVHVRGVERSEDTDEETSDDIGGEGPGDETSDIGGLYRTYRARQILPRYRTASQYELMWGSGPGLMDDSGIDGDLEMCFEAVETVRSLYQEYPVAVAPQLADAIGLAIDAHGTRAAFDEQARLLDQLETLYGAHETAAVAAGLVRALGTAASGAVHRDDLAQMDEYVDRVVSLADAHSTGGVTDALAGAIASALHASAGAGDTSVAERHLDRLEELHEASPDRDGIEAHFHAAITDLAGTYVDDEEFERAADTLDRARSPGRDDRELPEQLRSLRETVATELGDESDGEDDTGLASGRLDEKSDGPTISLTLPSVLLAGITASVLAAGLPAGAFDWLVSASSIPVVDGRLDDLVVHILLVGGTVWITRRPSEPLEVDLGPLSCVVVRAPALSAYTGLAIYEFAQLPVTLSLIGFAIFQPGFVPIVNAVMIVWLGASLVSLGVLFGLARTGAARPAVEKPSDEQADRNRPGRDSV